MPLLGNAAPPCQPFTSLRKGRMKVIIGNPLNPCGAFENGRPCRRQWGCEAKAIRWLKIRHIDQYNVAIAMDPFSGSVGHSSGTSHRSRSRLTVEASATPITLIHSGLGPGEIDTADFSSVPSRSPRLAVPTIAYSSPICCRRGFASVITSIDHRV